MSRGARIAVVVVVATISGAVVLNTLGGQGACLGPLGVTPVECARATELVPLSDAEARVLVLAFLVASVAALAIASVPVPAERRAVAVGAAVASASVAALAYVASYPRAMEGFTSSGEWISVPRPPDPVVLVAVAVAAACVALVAPGLVRAVARRLDRSVA